MASIEYGRTRDEIIDMVQKLLEKDGRPNPFNHNRPGKDWWYAFLRCHPEIALHIPEPLQIA